MLLRLSPGIETCRHRYCFTPPGRSHPCWRHKLSTLGHKLPKWTIYLYQFRSSLPYLHHMLSLVVPQIKNKFIRIKNKLWWQFRWRWGNKRKLASEAFKYQNITNRNAKVTIVVFHLSHRERVLNITTSTLIKFSLPSFPRNGSCHQHRPQL